MKTIELPGLKQGVTQLIMGSDYFAPEVYETVQTNLDAFTAIGGNTIDTAYIYYGGKSEQAIGMWLEERGNRDQMNIWTKGAHPNKDGSRVSKAAIAEELEISLERLRTSYVDLYALHRDDLNVPVGEILEWLNEHVEAGRILTFGASNWTTARLAEANAYAKANGLRGFSFSSPNLSLAKAQEPYWADCISIDEESLAWHEESGLPILSWSSQARGFFTGRFTKEDRSDADLVRVFYNDANWERYARAEQLAKQKGVTTIQIALAYVLNQAFPTSAIIGPRNQAEMESCKEATELTLTQEEVQWLDLR
ncbi:aryl-alcohol dehydrogenase-like predicted oxidoreductase [Paenibacillus phyllosphaerae]|uniref:Aryl-alcohol dehydrogenase-like predicted oxidoreductase n=1 Tax=Paenibacillus phyllosphaerae TaxID=274593 RepID=A0A7W5FLT1_9BACL|nr:aldo/keto reductase [Paenibacillus phyllosphaerae]MBB3109555.1 aryl-alcohol dehydrogenase-like predicted oxidoreductase [Paenibacillus phyllosphaerae]